MVCVVVVVVDHSRAVETGGIINSYNPWFVLSWLLQVTREAMTVVGLSLIHI